MQQIDDHGVMPSGVHNDLAFKGDGIHMDDIVTGHLGRRVVDHHAFEDAVSAQDQVDDPR